MCVCVYIYIYIYIYCSGIEEVSNLRTTLSFLSHGVKLYSRAINKPYGAAGWWPEIPDLKEHSDPGGGVQAPLLGRKRKRERSFKGDNCWTLSSLWLY